MRPAQSDCCGAKSAQPNPDAVAGLKPRRWLLFSGLALIVVAVALWRPIQQKCLAWFLLRTEAPSPDVLTAVVEQAADPAAFLRRLWNTQKIPHREFVLSYLSTANSTHPKLLQALQPLLLEATADPDIANRESAFATLAVTRHPQLRHLACQQLSDADPAARLLGLQSLRPIATSNDVPTAISLLSDPEPRVVVAAALVLRQATGQDFGIKQTHAFPQFTCIDTNPPPAPELAAIARGVQRWRDLWAIHQNEFPPSPTTPTPALDIPRLPIADFALPDSGGQPTRLSQLRGKTVLLAFWTPGLPASLDDFPALDALQRQNPDRLAVLGICAPPPPCCSHEHDHAGHAHDQSHYHHAQSATRDNSTQLAAAATQAAASLQLHFPMLLDSLASITLDFSVSDFPTYVLIDPRGMLCRRIVGFRSTPALAAMIEDVTAPKRPAASTQLAGGSH
jgi:peroxiredoxin